MVKMKIRTGITHPIELTGWFATGLGGGLPIAGFLRLIFLWLGFISLTIELSSTTYKLPNSVATLLRSHGIFKGRSAMAREAAGEHRLNQETAVSYLSLTALSAPIIYLVGSQLCVKMQLLIAAATNVFRYS